MSEELKPCPFCDGKAEISEKEYDEWSLSFYNRIYCSQCLAQTGRFYEISDAIAAWNRRADDERGT